MEKTRKLVFVKFNYKFVGDEIEEADEREFENMKKSCSTVGIESENKNQSNDTDDIGSISDDEEEREQTQYSDDDILDYDELDSDVASVEIDDLENSTQDDAMRHTEDEIVMETETNTNTTENEVATPMHTVGKTYYLKNGVKLLVLDK